jgi:hypothetical protein
MTEQEYKLTDKNKGDLAMFIGTERWYLHGLKRFTYTDGVKFLAENTQSHWLLDLIASYQHEKKFRNEAYQVWELHLHEQNKQQATVTCTDGNDNQLVTQILEYTDFPLDEIKLYLVGEQWMIEHGQYPVLMLPSEY